MERVQNVVLDNEPRVSADLSVQLGHTHMKTGAEPPKSLANHERLSEAGVTKWPTSQNASSSTDSEPGGSGKDHAVRCSLPRRSVWVFPGDWGADECREMRKAQSPQSDLDQYRHPERRNGVVGLAGKRAER